MLLKSVNHFPKFTKHFLSNENHFSVDHYFRPYQTPKNAEIIFQKPFYAETNGALALALNQSWHRAWVLMKLGYSVIFCLILTIIFPFF